MAQTGYTPILTYASGTPGNTPSASNLTSSASGAELAINYADGKLFYKDSGGTVQVLAVKMPSGILPIANGGTNATAAPTAGAVAYGTGTAYAFTSAGTSNQVLISNGSSAPSWSNLSSLGVTSLSFGTTGLTPSTATQGAITVAGTLATTNGGTGLTSFTANGVVYASSTSALTTGSALTFDGTNLAVANRLGVGGVTSPAYAVDVGDSAGGNMFRFSRSGTELGSFISSGTPFFGTLSNHPLAFTINGSEQMRLDSSGNLGLGVTPSAWVTLKSLEIAGLGNAISGFPSDAGIYVTSNAYYGSAGWRYGQSGKLATRYSGEAGVHSWSVAPSGTAGNAITFTQAMTLDASGNLGIGTSSPGAKLHVKGGNTNNLKVDNGGEQYTEIDWLNNGTIKAAAYWDNTNTQFYIGAQAANSTLGLATAGSIKAILDSSGNLGLGVTPSSWYVYKAMQVGQSGAVWSNPAANELYLSSNYYYSSAGDKYIANGYASFYRQLNGAHTWATAPSGTAGNAISFTQAMTLTSGGIWKLGTTGNGPYTSIGVMSFDGSTNWSVGPYSGNPGGFLITANASYGVYLATTTSTSWATASDERVKTDLEPITDAAAKVATLRAVTGRYIADPTGPRKPFLIAQDVLAVLPEAVDTSNPEKYGLAYTEVIPLLVAAIKEQQAIIEQLKADVAALKGN